MDIKIPFKWLKEYIETNLSAKEFAEKLSTAGPSIEKYKYNEAIDDEVLEIEVTSNRVDMASVIGIAREAKAVLNTPVVKVNEEIKTINSEILPIKISVLEPMLVPRYTGIVMQNVEVKESPEWMKKRLEAAGFNSINNIVDITNYVLLEYGQPTHAYDYDLIDNKEIIVRKSTNEKITVLGGREYELNSNILVIADKNSPIGIAGIKGGAKCEITSKTKNIFIESANFNADLIREVSTKILDLRTDASNLFEKDLSPQLADKALARIVQLIKEYSGGEIASNLIDVKNFDETAKNVSMEISLVKKTLGIDISESEILNILSKLGFECNITSGILNSIVPYYRQSDILFDYDLVEEIARIYGYDKIPSTLPMEFVPVYKPNDDLIFEDTLRDILSGVGLTEIFSYSMISQEQVSAFGIADIDHIKIANPISSDFEYMRSELTTSLLKAVAQNEKIDSNLEFFEVSNVYLKKSDTTLPEEESRLIIGISNSMEEKAFSRLKGVIEYLLKKLQIDLRTDLFLPSSNSKIFQPNASGTINNLGNFGLVSHTVLKKLNVETPVAIAEISVKLLKEFKNNQTKKFTAIEKFPPAIRDLSFILDKTAIWLEIEKFVMESSRPYVKFVELIDLFTGKGIPENKKSITIHIVMQSETSTLTDIEIEETINKITAGIEKNFNGTLRK